MGRASSPRAIPARGPFMNIRSCLRSAILGGALLSALPNNAAAAEVMCDPSFQDCRTMLLSPINAETAALDIAMLFMEDDAMADAIIARFNAGVPVRMLVE